MFNTRREFLALAAIAAGRAAAKPLGMPIGIQPYTVRNELGKDLEGTLRQIAKMGYQAIEVASPFYGKAPAEARQMLRSMGFSMPAGHFAGQNEAEWAKSVEDGKALGVKYMIANAPREWTTSLDGWKRAGDLFNRMGEQSKKAGITLAYHNHHFEFKVFDGVIAYEQLLRSTDPGLVAMEIDIFWITFAGQDPLQWFDRHPGRFPLWHVKDMKPGFGPSTDPVDYAKTGIPFAEIGHGTIDWKRVFGAAKQAGLRHYFVEQDRWEKPPLECARLSAEFLKKFKV